MPVAVQDVGEFGAGHWSPSRVRFVRGSVTAFSNAAICVVCVAMISAPLSSRCDTVVNPVAISADCAASVAFC